MFVFGTQYLRGATPAEDQWDKDMAAMKAYGFNTIRVWLVWNALEREEGVVDTAFINRLLTCAKKYDLQVGLLFHLHAAPAWAIAKYPQYYYVDQHGRSFEPAVRPNTPSGGWPGLCFDHDEVREIEKRFIEAVLNETQKHDNVAFYEPMNEPHQWVNGSESYCYCSASVKKFQAWLKNKYQTIDNLNRSWGHFFHDFNEVRPPRWTNAYSNYTDFRLFTMENIAEEIAYRTKVIKNLTDVPVIAHSWGGGAITCANLGGMAFDDWKNAAIFDKWGYSAFPGHANDCVYLGMGSAATRCAANGKEYWQSELTAGMVGTGLFANGRVDDNTFDKFSLESLRQGAKGLLYWQFRRERHGAEINGYALTDVDGGETNLSRRAGKLCKAITGNEDIFSHSIIEKSQVGIVFSIRGYLANWCNNLRDNKFAVDCVSGYYRMLWEENIATDILHEEFFGDLSQYKVIILPCAYAVSGKLAAVLKEYVKNGGTLLSDPLFGMFDEDMVLSYAIPGFGFQDVFGCKQLDQKFEREVAFSTGEVLSGNHQKELYREVTAEVLRSYQDGSPAILSNRYGKGRAVLSGVNLGLCHSQRSLIADDLKSNDQGNSSPVAKDIVLTICKEAGVAGNACTAPDVKYSFLTADAGTAVILINSGNQTVSGSVPLLSQDFKTAVSIYNEAHASLKDGNLCFTLEADQSAVVRLEK
ncbi:MAG: beta-galactosidase [Clostridia bacterium]|nr:beta-galactosidase [Clostridia bacterium]